MQTDTTINEAEAAAPARSSVKGPPKGPGDENFPVASVLIPARLRGHVLRYYAFARAADDIADDPGLSIEQKLDRLDLMEDGLAPGASGPAEAVALRATLQETGVSDRHPRDLLAAFRQDTQVLRYRDWEELMGYCTLSAHPVGRFMLELHGEGAAGLAKERAGDALCAALQVLNHLQDCAEDYRRLDRVYLPTDWLEAEGIGVGALDEGRASPALRRVLDRCLDGCDRLLAEAAPLPGLIRSRRLAAEVAVILRLAERLAARLRRADPLAGRVALGRMDWVRAGLAGLGRMVRP